MCNFGNGNGCCSWIILLIIVLCCCGGNNGGCGCDNNSCGCICAYIAGRLPVLKLAPVKESSAVRP